MDYAVGDDRRTISAGSHTIDYSPLAGYTTPAAESVTVIAGENQPLSRAYTAQPGSLTITLTPSSGMWRVDGGSWTASGATVGELGLGTHSVEYSTVTGYESLPTETIALAAGENRQMARSYAEYTGQLLVTTVPVTSTTTGAAQWRVGSGTWNVSGNPVALPVGTHTIEFKPAPGWMVPSAATVTISRDQQTSLTADYFYQHRLRFFLHQDLVAGLSLPILQARISQYAAHLQTIFHRETLRRFTFDPANDITLCTADPFSGSYNGTLPEIGFEVWAYVQLTDRPEFGSYGGNASFDDSGAGGGRNLRWDQIHDPSTLQANTPTMRQYWIQIDHMVHEFEHTFGAGLGEYYSIGSVRDETNIAPLLPPMVAVNSTDSHPFWDSHPEYWADPLTVMAYGNPRLGSPTSMSEVLAAVRFAPASVGVINGLNRYNWLTHGTLPNLAERVRGVSYFTKASRLPLQSPMETSGPTGSENQSSWLRYHRRPSMPATSSASSTAPTHHQYHGMPFTRIVSVFWCLPAARVSSSHASSGKSSPS